MRAADPSLYAIAVVQRTLDIIEALTQIGPAPLAALADHAGCTRTAAFRVLRTLQSSGYAVQDGARGAWRLGASWSGVARALIAQRPLVPTARPFMAQLAAETSENAYLHVREGLEGETVALHQADARIRRYHEPGVRMKLHAGSGRLLLAYASAGIRAQALAQRLPRYTDATRTDAGWLASDMERIRLRGWLITVEEVHRGAVSISAPVRDASGEVVAALSIASPRTRQPHPQVLLEPVLRAAAALSQALGCESRK